MNWLPKLLCVLYLSVCVFYQGLAVYVLDHGQLAPVQQSNLIQKSAAVASLSITSESAVCCDLQLEHEEHSDQSVPLMWEVDAHGFPHHPAYFSMGAIRISSSEHNNYPTPIYSFHRPPDILV